MVSLISNGVCVSVETAYQEAQSMPQRNYYLFAYHIKINNTNDFPIQVLKRYWIIKDALMQIRKVEGAGVVGVRPIILPNESFEYTSACDFNTEYGTMKGFYLAKNLITSSDFKIEIPEFSMITTALLN